MGDVRALPRKPRTRQESKSTAKRAKGSIVKRARQSSKYLLPEYWSVTAPLPVALINLPVPPLAWNVQMHPEKVGISVTCIKIESLGLVELVKAAWPLQPQTPCPLQSILSVSFSLLSYKNDA